MSMMKSKKDLKQILVLIPLMGVLFYLFQDDLMGSSDEIDSQAPLKTSTQPNTNNESRVKRTKKVIYTVPTQERIQAAAMILSNNLGAEEARLQLQMVSSGRAYKKAYQLAELQKKLLQSEVEIDILNKKMTNSDNNGKYVSSTVENQKKELRLPELRKAEKNTPVTISAIINDNGQASVNLKYRGIAYNKRQTGNKIDDLTILEINVSEACVLFSNQSEVCL